MFSFPITQPNFLRLTRLVKSIHILLPKSYPQPPFIPKHKLLYLLNNEKQMHSQRYTALSIHGSVDHIWAILVPRFQFLYH